jgi:hypothetical protein
MQHPLYHFSFAYAWRFALTALFMIACWSASFYAIGLSNKMLIAVNERQPADKKIKIRFNRRIWRRVRKNYSRLYPDGDLNRRSLIAFGAAVIFLVCAFYVPWNLLR